MLYADFRVSLQHQTITFMIYKYDFLIIGAGVAGMSYALKVARAKKGKVCMICKTSLDEANTSLGNKLGC